MSKSTPSTTVRAAFAAAAFSNLRAAAGEGQGEALRLLIADIDEDPDQPRSHFDSEELASLAASIKAYGVVQPIIVRPSVAGRYRLVVGARRLRASKLADMIDIPALLRPVNDDGFAVQLIENQQRIRLSNSDLAAAVSRLAGEGKRSADIGIICALKEYQVAAFRQVEHFPPALRQRLDEADIRALYELYRQWCKTPEPLLAALPDEDSPLTVTEARRIIARITGRSTNSPRPDQPPPMPSKPPALATGDDGHGAAALRGNPDSRGLAADASRQRAKPMVREPAAPRQSCSAPADTATAPVFLVVADDGVSGRLVVDQRAGRSGAALVAYADGVREVDVTTLRILAVG